MIGRSDPRWDEVPIAYVIRKKGASIGADALKVHVQSQLARFKAPKELIFVDHVHRLGNGKADYRWAKSQATEKAPMST